MTLAHTLGERGASRSLQDLSDELQAVLQELRDESVTLRNSSEQNWTLYESLSADLECLEQDDMEDEDICGEEDLRPAGSSSRRRGRPPGRRHLAATRLAAFKRRLSDLQDEAANRIDALLGRALDPAVARHTMAEYCRGLWPELGTEDDVVADTRATAIARGTSTPAAPASAGGIEQAAPSSARSGEASASENAAKATNPPRPRLPPAVSSTNRTAPPSARAELSLPSSSQRARSPSFIGCGQASIPPSSTAASGSRAPLPSGGSRVGTGMAASTVAAFRSAEPASDGREASAAAGLAVQPEEKENSQQQQQQQALLLLQSPTRLKEIMDAAASPPAFSLSPPAAAPPTASQEASANRAAAHMLAGLHAVPARSATSASPASSTDQPGVGGQPARPGP
jgi:hypothetical protein